MSYFPEIKDDRSSDPNLSPLNEIIQELKRKNVVASAASGGPQLALDSRSDPWGSSEAVLGIADDDVTVSFGRRGPASTIFPHPQTSSSIPFGDNDSRVNYCGCEQQQQQKSVTSISREEISPLAQQQRKERKNKCPDCGKLPLPANHIQDTSTNPTSPWQKPRLNPWLIPPPPKHAKDLLQVTPQLRIISSSSTDMNVAGSSSSNNALSMILSSTPFHHHFNSLNNKSNHASSTTTMDSSLHHSKSSTGRNGATTFSAGSTSTTSTSSTASDYKASLKRDRANHEAATELASLLWICAHEMSLENYGKLESKTFTSVFALVHSKDNMDRRMAGLAALDALIDAPSADEERKAIKFANTLSGGLRSARGNYEFLSAVSKALGHMATRTANIDFVESEVTRALEWLRTDRSDRRYVYSSVSKNEDTIQE